MSSLDVKPSAFMSRQIDRACLTGSRLVDGFCHRNFVPTLATKYFDYPGPRSVGGRRIWFDENTLISASSVTSGGVSYTEDTDFFLRPENSAGAEPFTYIELNRSGSASFSGGPQRAVTISGLWGYNLIEREVTALAATASSGATTITTVGPACGVGGLLRIDSERLLVTGKGWTDSGVTAPALTAAANSNIIVTASAALFTPFEKILIDGERMEVLDVYSSGFSVRRAVDGTALAAHMLGAPILWEHSLLVDRAVAGTTAASHGDDTPVLLWYPPSQISALARAYTLDNFLQENAGYARTSGQGENERPVSGRGIKDLEARCKPFVRSARTRTV